MDEEQKLELRVLNDGWAAAANAGDRDAAGSYLRRNFPYLSSMARWLARGAIEPDDLAAEATTSLLVVWSQGRGPTSNPNAYVIRSMRNRVVDERRSPRSRVQGTPDLEEEFPPEYMDTRDIDLHREYGYVREALNSLPADQQQVLRATVIDGRKPAELEEELGRSASAIYSLSHRAKAGLRRATLRIVLSDDAPEHCRHAAERLPDAIPHDVDDAADSAGMPHIRSCMRCRSAWTRFGGLATLGIVSLLVVGNTLGLPAPAHASGPVSADARLRRRVRLTRVTPLRILSLVGFVVGVSVVAFTLPSVIAGVFPVQQRPGEPDVPVGANLRVTALSTPQERATLRVQVEIDGDGELAATLTLPAGVTVSEAPKEWECNLDAPKVTCRLDTRDEGTFVLVDARSLPTGSYRLELSGDIGTSGIVGFAEGTITEKPETVSAVVE